MLDANGVVVDNVSYALNVRAQILAQINVHYGTSFSGWSDNEIGLRIGDTLPNWNAYEKILLPNKIYVAASLGNNGYSVGYIQGNKYVFYSEANQNTYIMSKGGRIIANGISVETTWNYRVKPVLINHSFENVTEYLTEAKLYNVGDIVENIGEYQFIE